MDAGGNVVHDCLLEPVRNCDDKEDFTVFKQNFSGFRIHLNEFQAWWNWIVLSEYLHKSIGINSRILLLYDESSFNTRTRIHTSHEKHKGRIIEKREQDDEAKSPLITKPHLQFLYDPRTKDPEKPPHECSTSRFINWAATIDSTIQTDKRATNPGIRPDIVSRKKTRVHMPME